MSNDQNTKPTLETLLERINEVAKSIRELRTDVDQRFDTVSSEIATLRANVEKRFEAVDNEIASLRKDVERGFRTFERKLGYLANDLILQRRVEQEEIFERIEALENKAS